MAANKRTLTAEVAGIARATTIPVYGGQLLPNTDETLRTRGGARGLAIYDDIERDAHAYAVLQKRKLAVVSREWVVEPASEAATDVAAAERVETQLKALGFDRVCLALLDALLKGYAVGEVIWEVRGAELAAAAVKPRDQRRFTFGLDGLPRLLTREQPMLGEELPARKFIVHSFGAKDGSPYGLGLGTRLFWPAFFKRQGITFWLTFADKFGSPTAVGKYPPGTEDKQRTELLEVLDAIAQDAGVTIPQGMEIELLEAQRSGSLNTYEALCRYMDEQLSEAVLGETLTTNIGDQGSRAAAETHNDVREELTKADADLLSDTLNGTLVRWISELNDPGATPPRVWRSFEEPEDLDRRSERDKRLYDMGLEPADETYWERIYGEKWVRRAQAPAPELPPNAKPPASEFAEQGPDTAARLAEEGEAAAAAAMDGLIEPVRRLVERAQSLEEIRDGLLDLYPGMAPGAFGELLQRAITAAELAGRGEAALS